VTLASWQFVGILLDSYEIFPFFLILNPRKFDNNEEK